MKKLLQIHCVVNSQDTVNKISDEQHVLDHLPQHEVVQEHHLHEINKMTNKPHHRVVKDHQVQIEHHHGVQEVVQEVLHDVLLYCLEKELKKVLNQKQKYFI
jgi:hypothetical protein